MCERERKGRERGRPACNKETGMLLRRITLETKKFNVLVTNTNNGKIEVNLENKNVGGHEIKIMAIKTLKKYKTHRIKIMRKSSKIV